MTSASMYPSLIIILPKAIKDILAGGSARPSFQIRIRHI